MDDKHYALYYIVLSPMNCYFCILNLYHTTQMHNLLKSSLVMLMPLMLPLMASGYAVPDGAGSHGVSLTGHVSYAPTDSTLTVPLSLDQCIEIALSDNPTIRVADMEVSRVDYSRREVLGQLLPNISFGATYNRTLAKQTMYMNMGRFGASSGSGGEEGGDEETVPSSSSGGGIKVGLDNSYQMGFNASVPIIAPQLWQTLKLGDEQILESVELSRQSRQQLVNQVKAAYYALLLANASLGVIQESYDMAEFTATLYQKQFEAGSASEYDVLRTQVALKNVEPELLEAEIAIKQAKLQLMILMGMEPTVNIEATGSLGDYENVVSAADLPLNTGDITGNADLRLLDLRTLQLSRALKIKTMAWYPTLSLTASYYWTSMSDGSPFKNFRWNPYSMVGLTFNLPLFTGGQRYNAVKQARIQVEEMSWQRENLQRTINMQVDLAIDNIYKNMSQISSSGENVGQAEKAHDIMVRSFEIGAATYLDLRDSELALTRTRLSYYRSIYNYLIARSELELLLGSYNVEPFMPAR